MKSPVFYIGGNSVALRYAGKRLEALGFPVALTPQSGVTHVLLDVPSRELPDTWPEHTRIIGGNLPPAPNAIDLLRDPEYLARNAAITAHCALKRTLALLPRTMEDCPVLILGWGRIAQSLARLAKALGARVTVAARNPDHRAMAAALGFTPLLRGDFRGFRVIYNTIPAPVLEEGQCSPDCVLMDLASVRGIAGGRVLWERGLPGREAPESSGGLIAETILRFIGKE